MKLFWIISTLAVLAAMIFGSLLHRRGQESPAESAESSGQKRTSRVPSFVSESQLPVQETGMPFKFPLMPGLLPEPKSDLPAVKFVSDSLAGERGSLPKVNEPAARQRGITRIKSHVSTVDLSKIEMPKVELPGIEPAAAVEEKVETIPAGASLSDGRFLPIVLHIGSEDGKLVLQGSIPTRENTDAVYAAAVKVVGEDSVENHLKYSPETLDADWVTYLPEYIEKFFSHSAGAQELIIVDGILKLRGDVASENSRNGLVVMADSLKEGGLEIETGLVVKESLGGELPELPGSYAALVDATPVAVAEPKVVIELAMLNNADQLSIGEEALSRSASISGEALEIESDSAAIAEPAVVTEAEPGLVVEAAPDVEVAEAVPVEEAAPVPSFVGPAVSPEEWAAGIKKAKDDLAAAEAAKLAAEKAAEVAAEKAKADAEAAAIAAAEKKKAEKEAVSKAKAAAEAAAIAAAEKKKAEMEVAAKLKAEEDAAALVAAEKAKAAKLAAMLASGERIPDDGKPLIFYFETGSAEIISSDREKLTRAKQRVQIPRSIVYITAYADYRGGYESNRKLSLERAEKVRGLIFSGDVADEVTAEITAKGDSQSVKRDVGTRESDEALKRARRVVVEVYHLKR